MPTATQLLQPTKNKMQRPDYDEIKTFEEFSKYYWYRNELIKICKSHGLMVPSGKIELNKVIESYFRGEILEPKKKLSEIRQKQSTKKKPSQKKIISELSLQTGLIECGFTFGSRFRAFFEKTTGVRPFKFNVDMVVTVKAVKESRDESFTLGDLLDIYYGRKTYIKYDNSALQWNKFVKDFCADSSTTDCSNKLKTAARLWKIVRESDIEKKYTHELWEKYKATVEEW